jgi:DNA-binding transcriptional LysR family regulator
MAGMAALMGFAETVKQGSFAGAARELGLSPSAVAKAVARLEADLGLRLLHRTTRRVSLTGDGTELYERCRRIVDDMEALREEAEGVRGKPRGTLRLNMPITWGRQVLVPKLAALARSHPELSFDVTFSDRFADLVREGFDAAVRVGPLSDSSLVARRIGTQQMILIASPAYLRRRGVPAHPEDLAAHDHLAFRMPTSGRPMPWRFREGKRAIEVVPRARTVFDDGDALARAVVEGMGIIQIPSYMAADDLKAKRLVELLPGFRPPPIPISLVLPSARQMTPRIRVLVEALAEPDGASETTGPA